MSTRKTCCRHNFDDSDSDSDTECPEKQCHEIIRTNKIEPCGRSKQILLQGTLIAENFIALDSVKTDNLEVHGKMKIKDADVSIDDSKVRFDIDDIKILNSKIGIKNSDLNLKKVVTNYDEVTDNSTKYTANISDSAMNLINTTYNVKDSNQTFTNSQRTYNNCTFIKNGGTETMKNNILNINTSTQNIDDLTQNLKDSTLNWTDVILNLRSSTVNLLDGSKIVVLVNDVNIAANAVLPGSFGRTIAPNVWSNGLPSLNVNFTSKINGTNLFTYLGNGRVQYIGAKPALADFSAGVSFEANNTGFRGIRLLEVTPIFNDNNLVELIIPASPIPGAPTTVPISKHITLNPNSIYQIQFWQDSGIALGIDKNYQLPGGSPFPSSTTFTIVYLNDLL